MNTTEEASDDQYGLSENILDELMDRSDIVKVSNGEEERQNYQSHLKRPLKYGSEEKGSSLCKCSILLGSFMSKKLERLRSELLSEDKITNLLGFLTK